MQALAESWTVVRDGVVVYAATVQHVALVTRALGIDRACWERAVNGYGDTCPPSATVEQRMQAFKESWDACSPHKAELPAVAPSICPVCSSAIAAWLARPQPALVYGRCQGCGHGLLVEGHAVGSIYQNADYFQRVDPATAAGYADYEGERLYREAKGARLLSWIETASHQRPQTLLEVGSGYGYTRQAAESMGMVTAGVDPNPHAAEHARELYGFETHVGSLGSALETGAVRRGFFDLAVYQFVLEHVRDLNAELQDAWRALRPGGRIALVVPSSDAREIDVFGSSYRSMRADHFHLFSRKSIELAALRAGLQPVAATTECNLHLLRGILSPQELDQHVYLPGLGPDLIFLARRPR